MFIYVGLQVSFTSWTPMFLVRVKGLSSTFASYSVSIFWLSMTTGRFLFGKFFHRSDLPLFLGIGSLVAALFISLTFSMDYPRLVIVLMVLSGLSLSSFYPNILALGANTFPRNVGFITGSLDASATIGSALFPWVIGPISEWLGFGRGILLVPILFLGLAVLFFYYPFLFKKAMQPQLKKLPNDKL
jgi:fucose permease